jgi:hypothetical protein
MALMRTLAAPGARLRAATLLILVCGSAAWPAMSPMQSADIEGAFDALDTARGQDAAQFLFVSLGDGSISGTDWQAFLKRHFENRPFTRGLGAFWELAAEQLPEQRGRLAEFSATSAAASLGGALAALRSGANPDAAGSGALALQWLQLVGPDLGARKRATVVATIERVLGSQGYGRSPLAGGSQVQDLDTAQLGIQLGLTLHDYLGGSAGSRSRVTRVLGAQGWGKRFYESAGIFVFDNGVLSEQHLASLANVFEVVGPRLHAIVAVIVPEATGINPATHLLSTTGQLVFAPAIPMTQVTDPTEFTHRVGQPVAPAFTIGLAQEIVRAIQAVQFNQRPEMMVRRNAILYKAGTRQEQYVRRSVPAVAYQQDPDLLLPAVSFLWFIDSGRTFQSVVDLAMVGQRAPVDSVLLLADLLSDGSNSTFLYRTSPDGQVFRTTTRIDRTHLNRLKVGGAGPDSPLGFVSADLNYVTGIIINGKAWSVELDVQGSAASIAHR